MADTFDPYHKWLGIPPREQPADHYRLLGVERFEDDSDVISLAADQRMHFLRSFQNGERAKLSQQLLNEIAACRVCLLDGKKKAIYDSDLKQKTVGATEWNSGSAETPVEDIAATLEFAAPETNPDWPPGPVADSESANLWSPKSDSSKVESPAAETKWSPKTKTRVLIVALLSGLAMLLFLGVMIGGVSREANEIAKKDADSTNLADFTEQTEQAQTANESSEAARVAEIVKKEKAARREEAERHAKANRKAAAEAAQREEERQANEKAKREAARLEQERREKQRIERATEDLKQKVEQSIDKADRLKNDSPKQALDVLRECRTAVNNAEVSPQLKQYYRQRLRSVAADIERRAAAQKAKQKKEAKEKWRREHPKEYLESLRLVKRKNGWAIEAALKLNEMKEPLAKLISEYKNKSTELKIKQRQINNLESKLLNDMQKLPGAFKNEEFREWVLNGRRRFGNESNRTRQMLDEWTRQYDHFRAQAPALANKLEQKVSQLQSLKNQLQENKRSLQDTLHEMEDLDQRAHELLQSIKETEQQLAEKKINIDSALQSTGLGLEEPNTTNVENLLKKVKGILDDDLIKSLPDRR